MLTMSPHHRTIALLLTGLLTSSIAACTDEGTDQSGSRTTSGEHQAEDDATRGDAGASNAGASTERDASSSTSTDDMGDDSTSSTSNDDENAADDDPRGPDDSARDNAVSDDPAPDDAPATDDPTADDANFDDTPTGDDPAGDDPTGDDPPDDAAADDLADDDPALDDTADPDLPTDDDAPPEADPTVDSMGDPIENPIACPDVEPTIGDPCDASVCKYGSEVDCRSRWVCSSGMWYLEFAKRDCPEVCPETEPSEGDPCSVHQSQCTYGETPECRSHWMCYEEEWWLIRPQRGCETNVCPDTAPEDGATCTLDEVGSGCFYDGAELCGCNCQWWTMDGTELDEPDVKWTCRTVNTSYPPSYLTSCPFEMPEQGTPCDSGSTCGYTIGDQCVEGFEIMLASCVDGAWDLQQAE